MFATKSIPTTSLDTSYLLGVAGGKLTLRIESEDAPAETVQIHASKCSIGSAENCTVRIEGADVRPVHCVILRGRENSTIRRWSDQTWLNGHHFTDSTLHAGDTIRIAGHVIQVMADTRGEQGSDDVPEKGVTLDGMAHVPLTDNSVSGISKSTTNRSTARRLMRTVTEERDLSERVRQIERQLLESLTVGSHPQIEQLRRTLESCFADRTQQQEQQWNKDRQRLFQQMDARTRRFEKKFRQLSKRQAALASERDALQQMVQTRTTMPEITNFLANQARLADEQQQFKSHEVARLQAELTNRQAEMKTLRRRLREQSQTFQERQCELSESSQRDIEALHSQVEQLQSQVEQLRYDLAVCQEELTESQNRVEDLQTELQARQAEFDQQTRALKETIQHLEDELSQLQNVHAATQRQHEQQIAELESRLATEGAELEQQRAAHQTATTQLQAAREQLGQRQTELAHVSEGDEDRRLELDERLAQIQRQLHDRETRLAEKEVELSEAHNQLHEVRNRLQKELAVGSQTQEEFQSQEAELLRRIASTKDQFTNQEEQLQTELKSLQQQLDESLAELARRRQYSDAQATELDNLQGQLQVRTAELMKKDEKFEQQVRGLESEITRLQEQIEEYNCLVAERDERSVEQTQRMLELESELEKARSQSAQIVEPTPIVDAEENSRLVLELSQRDSQLEEIQFQLQELYAEREVWQSERQQLELRLHSACTALPATPATETTATEQFEVEASGAAAAAEVEPLEQEIYDAEEIEIDGSVAEVHEAEAVEADTSEADTFEAQSYEDEAGEALAWDSPAYPTEDISTESGPEAAETDCHVAEADYQVAEADYQVAEADTFEVQSYEDEAGEALAWDSPAYPTEDISTESGSGAAETDWQVAESEFENVSGEAEADYPEATIGTETEVTVESTTLEPAEDEVNWESLLGNAGELRSPLLDDIADEECSIEEGFHTTETSEEADLDQDILASLQASMDAAIEEESAGIFVEKPGPLTESTDVPFDSDRNDIEDEEPAQAEERAEDRLDAEPEDEIWSQLLGTANLATEFGDDSQVDMPHESPTDTLMLLKRFGFGDSEEDQIKVPETDILKTDILKTDDRETEARAEHTWATETSDQEEIGIEELMAQMTQHQPAPCLSEPAPTPASVHSHADSDEVSIEDYMNQLLARVSSGPTESVTVTKTKPVAPPVIEPALIEVPAEVQPVEPPKEYVPRSLAPEQASSLRAMRELANESTRSAISRHNKVVEELDAARHFTIAIAVVMVGGIVYFLGSGAQNWLLMGPGLVAVVVGIGMGIVAGKNALAAFLRKRARANAMHVDCPVQGEVVTAEKMPWEEEAEVELPSNR